MENAYNDVNVITGNYIVVINESLLNKIVKNKLCQSI